jgi:hypothetical protein
MVLTKMKFILELCVMCQSHILNIVLKCQVVHEFISVDRLDRWHCTLHIPQTEWLKYMHLVSDISKKT